MAFSLRKGLRLVGETRKTYVLSAPLIQRKHPHVWRASCSNNEKDQVVIKHPQFDDNPNELWPASRKEMEMQIRFQSARFIRKMTDTIPASSGLPGMMVLEPFEKTLWSTRLRRPLTIQEIKHIMKRALLGLREIHNQGLVYCGGL